MHNYLWIHVSTCVYIKRVEQFNEVIQVVLWEIFISFLFCAIYSIFSFVLTFLFIFYLLYVLQRTHLKSENKLKIFKKRQLGYLKGSILIWNFEWIQLTLAMPNKFIFLSHKKNIILGTYLKLKHFQNV